MNLRNLDRQTKRIRQPAEELEAETDLTDRFGPYRARPVAFVEEMLGADPEPYQRDVLTACVEGDRVAWRVAHAVSKTAVLTWMLLWWLLTRPFSRVLVAAPAIERQVARYLLSDHAAAVEQAAGVEFAGEAPLRTRQRPQEHPQAPECRL